MPKFPEPPAAQELRRILPAERSLKAGTILWRIYRRGGPHPALWQAFRQYGPLNGRFDHHLTDDDGGEPQPQDRGIYYAAFDLVTALAESFQETRVIYRNASDQPWLVGFELADPLRLLDLTGAWPTRAGASMVINSGPRPRAQRWSRAIFDAYPGIQGIYSASSRYANRPVASLYKRAEDAFPGHPTIHRPLSDPAILVGLERAAVEISYDLI